MSTKAGDIELQPSVPIATPRPIPSPNPSSSRLAMRNDKEQLDGAHKALTPPHTRANSDYPISDSPTRSPYSYAVIADSINIGNLDGAADTLDAKQQKVGERMKASTLETPSLGDSPTKQVPVTLIETPNSFDGNGDDIRSLNGLIDDLESEPDETLLEKEKPSDSEDVPENLLHTDQMAGLSDGEVAFRRRRYGLNELSDEKQGHVRKFFSFFVGPIQFVMEVYYCRTPV